MSEKYPWPMDKDVGYFAFVADGFLAYGQKEAHDTIKYLVERLKIAEAERDEYKDRWLYDEKNETF